MPAALPATGEARRCALQIAAQDTRGGRAAIYETCEKNIGSARMIGFAEDASKCW